MSSTGTANRMTKHPTRGCVPPSGILPRTFLWLAFALLCLAFLSKLRAQEPPAKGSPANPFDHYATAKTLLAKGEEGQASAEFQTFLIEVLHQLATAAAEGGNFAKASPWFEEALTLTPKDADLRSEYARAAFQAVKFPEARRLAEEAVRLEPDNPQTRLLLGQVLYQLHDLVAARSQLETVFAKNPDFGTGYLLGKTDLLLHEDKAARALFDTMLRQWGDTPINHIFLGRAYSQSGYQIEAAAEFHQSLTRDPQVRGAHFQPGVSYLRDDPAAEDDQAIPHCRAELDLDPNDLP